MKTVLVFNMPEKCLGCPCSSFNPQAKRWECDATTLTKGRFGVIKMEEKPDWCPLKPMPEMVEVSDDAYVADYLDFDLGWNACLKAITGETE